MKQEMKDCNTRRAPILISQGLQVLITRAAILQIVLKARRRFKWYKVTNC